MANIVMGLVIGFISLIIMAALVPPLATMVNPVKASDSLNCPGYIDVSSGQNLSYNSTLRASVTSVLGCSMIGLTLGFYVLGAVIAVLLGLLASTISLDPRTQQF